MGSSAAVQFKASRVRGGEWIIGGASLALLVSTFVFQWYGLTSTFAPTAASEGYPTGVDAWNGLATLRWLILLTGLVGLLAWWLQSTRRAPALPVAFTAIEAVLSGVLLLGLIWRILIDKPAVLLAGDAGVNVIAPQVGAYAGLVLTAAILAGTYISLREDGVAPADGPAEIEQLRLAQRPPARVR
jgi:hypothetical protein